MTRLVLSLVLFAIYGPAPADVKGFSRDMQTNRTPAKAYTSFQTPTGYAPENDIRTDAVIVYSCQKERIQSWAGKGFVVQTMYGFRTGPDYIEEHPDEGQTMANGEILTCGPGSYYMVPTQRRIDAAVSYFREAMDAGTTTVIPEEPEYFVQTGYSEAFKREWEAYYGEPWQDQTSSIEARWKSERLKAHLQHRMVKAILEDAASYKPDVERMVAAHSAVSYFNWGIIYPHYQTMILPELQGMIGQVWTGTARTPCRYEGVTAERTFEYGYLEYSSLWNLMRGTGKRLWFLMDPLEDNPDRSMEDYQSNYEKTLVASLMFLGVDAFEVMPWPNRIFGRVPDEFATKIMTIVTMLGDIHNQRETRFEAGTEGIATFVADSMGWQRGEPHAGNYDCLIGITLPLVMRGIPVQVAQLERAPEPGYLDQYKVILLSYDIMKPMDESYNKAMAKWVREGGTLILFGGTDAYNDLPEWWRTAGFRSPQEHLLAELGVRARESASLISDQRYRVLGEETKPVRSLENRKAYVFDVSDFVHDGQVFLKLEDSLADDGWGPSVFSAELRVNGKSVGSFTAGSQAEREHIFTDDGSIFNGAVRFADRSASWAYRFDVGEFCSAGSDGEACCPEKAGEPKVEVVLDMGNQFRVSVAESVPASERAFHSSGDSLLAKRRAEFVVPASVPITAYDVDSTPLYHAEGTRLVPFFEQRVGNGTLVFVGISPSFFAASKESAAFLRDIVRYGCEKSGTPYRERRYMKVSRGRYVALRTFDGSHSLRGCFVDVLDPKIPVVTNPRIRAGGLGVFADCAEMLDDSKPRVLLSSNRIESSAETTVETKLLLTGPLKTKGIVRLSTAGMKPASIVAQDPSGDMVDFEQALDAETLAITYDSLPEGVLLTIEWERKPSAQASERINQRGRVNSSV